MDSSVLLEKSKGKGVVPIARKVLYRYPGIQEKAILFTSTVPIYRTCVGKVRGLDGMGQTLKLISLVGSGFLFQAGEKAILILRTINGIIILIF